MVREAQFSPVLSFGYRETETCSSPTTSENHDSWREGQKSRRCFLFLGFNPLQKWGQLKLLNLDKKPRPKKLCFVLFCFKLLLTPIITFLWITKWTEYYWYRPVRGGSGSATCSLPLQTNYNRSENSPIKTARGMRICHFKQKNKSKWDSDCISIVFTDYK